MKHGTLLRFGTSLTLSALVAVASASCCDSGSGDSVSWDAGQGKTDVPVVRALGVGEGAPTSAPLKARADLKWVLAWDLSDVDVTSTGALMWTTDLGYRVTLAAAHLALVGVEAVPCTAEESAWHRAKAFLSPRNAYADHSYDHDASALSSTLVESVTAAETQVFGASNASGGSYCGVHLLSMPVAEACKDGTWMLGESVHLSGTFRGPGGQEDLPLEASLSLSQGTLADIYLAPGVTLPADGEAWSSATITLTRNPKTSLDGVKLDEESAIDIADTFLRRLLQSTVVTVRPGVE